MLQLVHIDSTVQLYLPLKLFYIQGLSTHFIEIPCYDNAQQQKRTRTPIYNMTQYITQNSRIKHAMREPVSSSETGEVANQPA